MVEITILEKPIPYTRSISISTTPPMEVDGGRRRRARHVVRPLAASKNKMKTKKKNKQKKNAAAKANASVNVLRLQPRHAVPFSQLPAGVVSAALRERLEELGATEPAFMIGKSLVMSDVNRDQARLLLSCKRDEQRLPQVTRVFTETEMDDFVRNEDAGLLVTALGAADGRSYGLTCKYLRSNSGYRFITGWKAYVRDNGLDVARHVVELWWFRSRKLHNAYGTREEGDKKKTVPVTVDMGHADGSLGLVLLHYENDQQILMEPAEQAAAAAEPDDEAPLPVQETEKTTGNIIVESKTTTTTIPDPPEEDKLLADGGGERVRGPIIMDRNTIISMGDRYFGALALLKLQEYYGGRGGGGGGGRGQQP